VIVLALSLVLSASALAEPTEPPTAFEGGYEKPVSVQPDPVWDGWAYVDVTVLSLFLVLGTMFLHAMRSRRAVRGLSIVALAYFGFFRHGCVCAVGAVQNVALAIGQGQLWSSDAMTYAVPIPVLAMFVIPLVWTLFAGRVFCGAVCPMGAIQDLVHLRSFRVPSWVDAGLRLMAVAVLLAAVLLAALGAAFIICAYDPFVGFFRLSGPAAILLAGGAVLALGMVVGRPFCRWACPYGVLLAAAGRLSKPIPLNISPTVCVTCRLCERICPVDAISTPASTGPIDADARRRARRSMAWAVLAVPVLVAAGAVGGALAGSAVANVHPTVRAAVYVAADQGKPADAISDATRAARQAKNEDGLLESADSVRRQFVWGTSVAAAVFGLAVGGTLISLSRRRANAHYEVNAARCVSCARCYSACPVGRRRGNGEALAETNDVERKSKTD